MKKQNFIWYIANNGQHDYHWKRSSDIVGSGILNNIETL